MIRVEKMKNRTEIEIRGEELEILAECTALLKRVKTLLKEDCGKAYVRDMIDTAYNIVWMSDEEIKEETERAVKDLLQK